MMYSCSFKYGSKDLQEVKELSMRISGAKIFQTKERAGRNVPTCVKNSMEVTYGCISMSEGRIGGNKVKKDKRVQDVWSLVGHCMNSGFGSEKPLKDIRQ